MSVGTLYLFVSLSVGTLCQCDHRSICLSGCLWERFERALGRQKENALVKAVDVYKGRERERRRRRSREKEERRHRGKRKRRKERYGEHEKNKKS